MFNLDESKNNYENFKNIIEVLQQKIFEDMQNYTKDYNDTINDNLTTEEEKEFCKQQIAAIQKQYEKNKRKIKEFYSQFVDILLNN